MILLPLVAVFVLLVFLASIIGLLLALERRAARSSGMSETTPVCGACHYRLGGWTSSTCPECGVDVRESRVRVGPRTSRVAWTVLLVMLSLMVVAPISFAVLGSLFEGKHYDLSSRYASASIPQLYFSVDAEYTWMPLPSRLESKNTIHAIWFIDGMSGSWSSGQYTGRAKRRSFSFSFDDQTGAATPEVIDYTLRRVIGEEADELTIREHAAAVAALCEFILDHEREGQLTIKRLNGWQCPPMGPDEKVAGGSSGPRSHWLAMVLALSTVLISLWLSFGLPGRYARSGWRAPRDGEWGRVTLARHAESSG